MKRVIFPSIAKTLFFVALLFLLIIIGWGLATQVIPNMFYMVPGESVIINIIACVLMVLAYSLAVFSGFWYYMCYCRLVIWNEKSIQRGLILPQRFYWNEKPRVVIASTLSAASKKQHSSLDSLGNKKAGFWEQPVVCLVNKEYTDQGSLDYGIGEIWIQKFLKEHVRLVYEVIKKIRANYAKTEYYSKRQLIRSDSSLTELSLPNKIVWAPYTYERYAQWKMLVNR